jgi:hypothetical protein
MKVLLGLAVVLASASLEVEVRACRLPAAPPIVRIVAAHRPELRACYGEGLRKNRNLRGRVAVKFAIDTSGHVTSAKDGGSDLPDSDVVRCILGVFSRMWFPMPLDHGTAVVVYPLVLISGDAKLRDVLTAANGRFRACYENALVARPSLEGIVRLRLVVAEDGVVLGARVEESSLEGPQVQACIVDVARGLRFPRSDGGSAALVHTMTFRR